MKAIKQLLILCGTITILFSCATTPSREANNTGISDSLAKKDSIKNKSEELTVDKETAMYYVVIADTANSYAILHKKMFEISNKTKVEIDTMGRLYNKKKQLIALPENAEDEIYAGDYFPRRFPSNSLSLEYLNFYLPKSNEKTIAIVAGIFSDELSADSCLHKIQSIEKNTFKIKAEIYIGCMH